MSANRASHPIAVQRNYHGKTNGQFTKLLLRITALTSALAGRRLCWGRGPARGPLTSDGEDLRGGTRAHPGLFRGERQRGRRVIGLLFVAISVAADRLAREEGAAQLHRVRAAAALTAFINVLAVSLSSLVPGHKIGPAALVMAIAGLVFVLAALLSLIRLRQVRLGTSHDALFLIGLILVFVFQLIEGADVVAHPRDAGSVNTIAILVIVCALVGVARSWELIGLALDRDHS